MLLVKRPQTCDAPRYTRRQVTRDGFVSEFAARIEVHAAAGRRRRYLAKVERRSLTAHVQEREPAATDIAGCRPDHRKSKRGGHGGVDSRPATSENLDADARGERSIADDHAMLGRHRIGVRSEAPCFGNVLAALEDWRGCSARGLPRDGWRRRVAGRNCKEADAAQERRASAW